MESDRIKYLIDKHLEGTDLFLVGLKESPGKLTVYVDREGGVSIAQCAGLNRFLRDTPEMTEYTQQHEIEVSSPGPDVPLRDYRQYISRIGKRLHVILTDGSEQKGMMVGADRAGFEIRETAKKKKGNKKHTSDELSEEARHIDYSDVREARVEFTF